jgi:hypothetical protein
MATAQQVLEAIQAVTDEIRSDVAECAKHAPGAKGFKTEVSLVGDPDVGTLIDAAAPVLGQDGTRLPKAFEDCIRGQFQTLELPPMKTGDRYMVTFEIGL